MSEMATEHRPAAKRENVFTRKLGPLPMWAWVAIVSAVLIGYFYLKNKKAGQTTPTGTNASQIPQFVNQVFTSVQPPGTPPPDIDKDKDKRPGDDDDDRRRRQRWIDEARKDKRIRTWEHHHPGQEYPFNTWQGNPTAAELAAYNANPSVVPPTMPQGNSWPVNPAVGTQPWQGGPPGPWQGGPPQPGTPGGQPGVAVGQPQVIQPAGATSPVAAAAGPAASPRVGSAFQMFGGSLSGKPIR